MAELNLNPVTIGKSQMDSITMLFADEPGGAEPTLARQLTSEVAIDYPELITYEGLKDGTAPLFDQIPQFKDVKPEERSLSNSQIISLFAVDEQGDPIKEGTFAGGFKRNILPSSVSLAGAVLGAKTGAKLQQPIPPAGPLAVAVKTAIPVSTTLIGLFGGYEAGETGTDLLFGPEKPVTPGSRAVYEAGKTGADVAAYLALPYMISKDISFGAAELLSRIAETAVKGPLSTRLIRGAEKLLSKTGEAARAAPVTTLGVELGAGVGATGGAYTAETVAPGSEGTRLAFELGFSVPGSIIGNRVVKLLPNIKSLVTLPGKMISGEFKIGDRRRKAAVRRIIDIIEAEGENLDAIIERLASTEMSEALIDPDTGRPITLTAGMKANSPALLAIEASLAQTSPGLGKERAARNTQASNALRNVISALVATGQPEALQMAAQLSEEVFTAGMNSRLQRAADNVVSASEKVRGTDPKSNIELSQKLFDLTQTQLQQARNQEKNLWRSVQDQDINIFRDADGNEVSQPNFLTTWQTSMPKTQEAAEEINKKLAPLTKFVNRKVQELGLSPTSAGPTPTAGQNKVTKALGKIKGTPFEGRFNDLMAEIANLSVEEQVSKLRQQANSQRGRFSGKRTKDYANLLDAQAELLAAPTTLTTSASTSAPLTVNEATEMRQIALSLSKQFTAAQDFNTARIASNFANSLLDDLNYSVPEGENAAYDIARSYSKALNDTFTRAFGGSVLEKGKSGAERIAPELLANRLQAGGADPTYLRIKQINDIGKFAIDNGFEGAQDIANDIRGTQEMIIRNARAAAFDSTTGEVNLNSLKKWVNSNQEILDVFPALRADLNNAQRANTVLKGRQAQNKSAQDALKGQITFRDLLPQNAESPTFVVGRALSSGQKTPLRALNNLWNVVENAPEELKEGAASGLKNAILEWSMTKGGATSRSFSPRAMYDSLFSKIPNAQANVSVMDWMLSRGAITEAQSKKLKSYLTEMVRLEVMDSQGTLEDIAQGAGPMLDFYLRITGSAVGSRLQGLLPGGGGSGGLIAASAGSRAMRNIFDKVPESMKMDVMSEMMQNPELLAAMMRKVRNDKEKIRVAGVVGTILDKLGFIDPVVQAPRRAVPLSVSGEEIEEIQIEEEDNQSSVQPQTVPAQPVAPPTTQVAPAISAPIQQSAVQGPVDRSRYAALFPTDIASGMIRQQGIGSLMG